MITIISVGKIKKDYLKEGIDYYSKQIPDKITFIEINDESEENGIDIEGDKILTKIKKTDYVIALAIKGKEFDSITFSNKIDLIRQSNNSIVFLIGGSYGLSKGCMKRANELISFSKMTFPHQIMKLILVEQIYRAFMIQKNHPYHK